VHGEVSRLLHRLDREIAGCLDDDCPLATDPGDNRRAIFVGNRSGGNVIVISMGYIPENSKFLAFLAKIDTQHIVFKTVK
jgi:hypothetical protein